MLKLLVHKFRPDLLSRLKDIAEKQVPATLKPIVAALVNSISVIFTTLGNKLCLLQTYSSECANELLEIR